MEENYYTEGSQIETTEQGPAQENNTLGVVGLVTGILGLVFAFCCSPLGVLMGIVAVVCGIIASGRGQKFALAGIIMGAIAFVLGILLSIILMPFIFILLMELSYY